MSLENEKNIKEDFCPVCVAAVPLAFSMAGAGSAKVMEQNDIDNCDGEDDEKEKHKKRIQFRNKCIYSICGVIGIVSLIVIIYFIFFQKCDDCEKVIGNNK
jgi:NhaP-type Na+/H+ or K+/H+ antiporter